MSNEPNPVILPPAEARKRYLIYVAARFFGLAVMAVGVWLARSVGQAEGFAVVLIGGLALFLRPKHLGLTRK